MSRYSSPTNTQLVTLLTIPLAGASRRTHNGTQFILSVLTALNSPHTFPSSHLESTSLFCLSVFPLSVLISLQIAPINNYNTDVLYLINCPLGRHTLSFIGWQVDKGSRWKSWSGPMPNSRRSRVHRPPHFCLIEWPAKLASSHNNR